MASEEEVIINTRMAGKHQFLADAAQESAAMRELGLATDEAGMAMSRTSRRGYLMNQALFTVRRMLYGVTLATIATGAAAIKLGWNYNSAMQQATVALMPLQSATFNVRDELTKLFNFTKYTPFQFKDVTTAFRQMYGAMSPLGITANQVNYYIKAMTDALSFAGRTTPAALNRVAIALQHVAFLGRLTGQNVTQLARDGLPVYAALRKELGLTGDQLHNIGKLGIPANVALNAITRYIETTPGYANAAFRQATGSLHGIFTTFKDNLSQLMGEVESGFFHRMQNDLNNFNKFLSAAGKNVQQHGSLTELVGFMNNRLTPGNNGIITFYHLLAGTIHDLWFFVSQLTGALVHSSETWSLVFAGMMLVRGAAYFLAGSVNEIAVGLKILIPLWIAYKVVTLAAAIATGVNTFATKLSTVATKDMTFAQFLAKLAIGEFMIAERLATASTWLYTAAQTALTIATGKLREMMIITNIVLMENPIILIIAAAIALTAGLVILYYKWKWFHNEVNSMWRDLIYWSPLVAAALTFAFGPIGVAIAGLLLVIRYWRAISNFFGGGASTPNIASQRIQATPTLATMAPHTAGIINFPRMSDASGSAADDSPRKRRPGLLRLGSGVTRAEPGNTNSAYTLPDNWTLRQPVNIPVYMHRGGKKLGEANAELQIDAMGKS